MAKFLKRKEPEQNRRRPLLDQRQKELMMAMLLRSPQAFAALRSHLKPEHFGNYEQGYALVWTITLKLYEKYGVLPDKPLLLAEIENACNEAPGTLNETEADAVGTFLDWAYEPANFKVPLDTDKPLGEWAVEVAKRFLLERVALQAKALTVNQDTAPADLNAAATAILNQAAVINSISSNASTEPFPEDWDQDIAVNVFPTGIDFIDQFMGGGHANGEVYGIMGPYGSCKTTLANMLAAKAVAYFAKQHAADSSQPRKVVVLVSYEDRLRTMRQRVLGYAARIKRSVMEALKDRHKDLSRAGGLREYEKRLFRAELAQKLRVPGEFERAAGVVQNMNNHAIFLDMTGFTVKGIGGGYFNEISAMVSAELQRRGNAVCGLVIADYVGAAAKRHVDITEGLSNDDLRHLIGGAPLKAKSTLADKFDCPVCLLHQLSAEANSFSEAKLADYTNSAEAKNFAENLDFCFIIGRLTKDNVGLFGCTKHRRTAGKDHTLIQVQGDMYQVVCVDGTYCIDTSQRKIMRLEEYQKIGTPQEAPAAGKAPVAGDNPVSLQAQ